MMSARPTARKCQRSRGLETTHASDASPPATAAQQVCDRVTRAGVTSILNFAPIVLSVPDGVDVRKVDLSIELQILAFHEQRKADRGGPIMTEALAEAIDL